MPGTESLMGLWAAGVGSGKSLADKLVIPVLGVACFLPHKVETTY